MRKTIIITGLVMSLSFMVSCNKDENNSGGSGSKYIIAVIDHMGFDFSENKRDTSWNYPNGNDGETIAWQPMNYYSMNKAQKSFGDTLYFRNSSIDTVNYNNHIKHFGAKELKDLSFSPDDITEAYWDSVIHPLNVGHTYAAKCWDGYVIFEVLSLDTNVTGGSKEGLYWPAQIKYRFFSN